MKNILIISLFIASSSAISQNLIKAVNFKVQKNSSVFQIVEQEKNQFSLFFIDDDKVKTIKFNEKFEVIDSLSAQKPETKYDDIAGYSITGNKYYTYWTSSNNKEIAVQCFDFDNKKVTTDNLKIEFVKEKTLKKITINNIFYLITISKNTSIINFYILESGKLIKKSMDLSDKVFLNTDCKKAENLFAVLDNSTFLESYLTFQNILTDTPPSLALAAKKRKLYTDKNHIILTIDQCKNFTQLLSIDITNFTSDLKSINQPFYEVTEFDSAQSNSFLIDDKLLQIKSNSEKMTLLLKDLDGNEIKSYEVLADSEISFKNSEIIQENGSVSSTRILEKTNQLVRKISNLYPSVSCYSKDDKIFLTLGAVSQVQQNNGIMIGGMIGGFSGAMIGAMISTNYSVENINSYANRKVVYINCVFDKKLNHIPGDVNKLPFDKLRAFSEEDSKSQFKTIFKLNNQLILGGYDKKTSQYSFYKFEY